MTKEKLYSEEFCKQDKSCIYECIREELYSKELGSYVSYGLRCTHEEGNVLVISDISAERNIVETLARICNDEALECIHIYDVIEDFLAQMC